MSSSRALIVALAVLTASAIFSVPIMVAQVSILPNRPATFYELGFSSTRNIRITSANLQLLGDDVYQVSLTYTRGAGALAYFVFQVELYDEAGGFLSTGRACVAVPSGAGTGTVILTLTSNVHVDKVGGVATCVVNVNSCPSSVSCL